jgi:hypothetical protein
MKYVAVECTECGVEFEKPIKEAGRSKKLGRPHFCSRTCSTTHRNKNLPIEERLDKCYQIKRHANNRRDEYSPFRAYLNRGRCSLTLHKVEIDVKYLKQLWDKQKGICPYTGIKMILPETTDHYFKIRSLKKASLDRIDSSKDYVEENVEFVCCGINMAKNSFTREEMKKFIVEMKNAETCSAFSKNGGPVG